MWWRKESQKFPSCPVCDPGKWGKPELRKCDRTGWLTCPECANDFDKKTGRRRGDTYQEDAPKEKKSGGTHHVYGYVPKSANNPDYTDPSNPGQHKDGMSPHSKHIPKGTPSKPRVVIKRYMTDLEPWLPIR